MSKTEKQKRLQVLINLQAEIRREIQHLRNELKPGPPIREQARTKERTRESCIDVNRTRKVWQLVDCIENRATSHLCVSLYAAARMHTPLYWSRLAGTREPSEETWRRVLQAIDDIENLQKALHRTSA